MPTTTDYRPGQLVLSIPTGEILTIAAVRPGMLLVGPSQADGMMGPAHTWSTLSTDDAFPWADDQTIPVVIAEGVTVRALPAADRFSIDDNAWNDGARWVVDVDTATHRGRTYFATIDAALSFSDVMTEAIR